MEPQRHEPTDLTDDEHPASANPGTAWADAAEFRTPQLELGEGRAARWRALLGAQRLKRGLVVALDASGSNRLLLRAQRGLLWPYARALNYHDVPVSQAHAFEAQLRLFTRHFVPVGLAQLRELQRGDWRHEKPGLLLTFDDGLRTHADVVAPLLEKYGFTGWFNVPVGFVVTPVAEQRAFARGQLIDYDARGLAGERSRGRTCVGSMADTRSAATAGAIAGSRARSRAPSSTTRSWTRSAGSRKASGTRCERSSGWAARRRRTATRPRCESARPASRSPS
jgi:hypothetical protein